jgi:hypothetical protein
MKAILLCERLSAVVTFVSGQWSVFSGQFQQEHHQREQKN